MAAVLLAVRTNIRKNKTQNALIGIILLLCCVIMNSGIATFFGVSTAYDTMSSRLKTPDIMMYFDNRLYDAQEIYDWWKEEPQTAHVSAPVRAGAAVNMSLNGEKKDTFTESVFFAAYDPSAVVDLLQVEQGDQAAAPSDGEVWVPTGFANTLGIKPGDIIRYGNQTKVSLVVTAIVVDPVYSSGFMQPARLWVNDKSLDAILENGDGEYSLISVTLDQPREQKSIWKKFDESLENSYAGFVLDGDGIRSSYLIMTGIITAVLFMFSVLILLITLYIVSNTLKITILSDFQEIGIMKSQGMTPNGVTLVYLLQYGLITVIALLIGSLAGVFLSRFLISLFSASMGFFAFDVFAVLKIVLIVFVVFFIIAITSVLRTAGKAGKVNAVQAIRFGAPREAVKGKPLPDFLFNRTSPSAVVSFKRLASNTGQSVFISLSFAVMVIVLVFSVNIYLSVTNMADHLSAWGFENSDVRVSDETGLPGENSDLEKILSDERVKEYAVSSNVNGTFPATAELAAQTLMGTAFGGDMDAFGYVNLEGENPKTKEEISLAVHTANDYGKEIGDEISVKLNDRLFHLTVTGIYQSVNNLGRGFRVQEEILESAYEDYEPANYSILLKDVSEIDDFVADYEGTETVSLYKNADIIGDGFSNISVSVGAGVVSVSVIFLAMLIIIISGIISLAFREERRSFGILQSLGMTPGEIRFSFTSWIVLLFVFGLLIGVPAGVVFTPMIMNGFMSGMGVIRYPLDFHVPATVLILVFALLVFVISSWMPTRALKKESIRDLLG